MLNTNSKKFDSATIAACLLFAMRLFNARDFSLKYPQFCFLSMKYMFSNPRNPIVNSPNYKSNHKDIAASYNFDAAHSKTRNINIPF